MRRPALALALATTGVMLAACSVSITANEDPAPEATAEATIAASEASNEYYAFCVEEAKGGFDLIAAMGDAAGEMIKDGIQQSIEQQGLVGADQDACVKAWVETLAASGMTYDPATGAVSGTLTLTPDATAFPSSFPSASAS